MNRREFLAAGAVAAGTLATVAAAPSAFAAGKKARERLRVGIVGVGARGINHLQLLLNRDDVDVVALCDIEPIWLERALARIAKAGKRKPQTYGANGDVHAYRQMYAKAKLDAVLVATPWEWHAPMAIDAMKAKIPVGCEVVAGESLDEHWEVLRTQLATGTPYMLLENVCYRRDVLAVLQMVRGGLFGEIEHLQAGYQHDLRGIKLNDGKPDPTGVGAEFGAKAWSEARWRTAHSVRRNGDLYPSHGIGPCAMYVGINRGNRFTRLNAFATRSRGLHEYIVEHGGENHPNAATTFALGDVVTTQIACANGETVLLQHDTSLPRPYSLGFRVQGTRGLWMDVNKSIHVEGKSKPHEWDPAQPYLDQYDHPLWKRMADRAIGAGHGGMDFFVIHAFVEALKANAPMPIDIYDAVTWSAITPLSEASIRQGFQTVDFPDFTDGAWRTRKPIFALDGNY